MEARKIILSVDMGTSSVKVALITVDGQVLGWESEPLELILTQDGGTEPVSYTHLTLPTNYTV